MIEQKKSHLQIIRTGKLADLLGVSRTTIWRMEQEGKLPPRVRISEAVSGWLASDIEKWLEGNRIGENDE